MTEHGSLRVAGLFAGIGGIELGLQRAGHRTVLLCEADPAARAVLESNFRHRVHHDVRELEQLPRTVDVVAAGFPCQDLSQAGRARGIRGAKSRLVDHVFRLLDASARQPEWVLFENVPFMLRLDGGSGMRSLTRRLQERGYRWAYRVIDTHAFGLPQRRERVFLLASRTRDPARALLVHDRGCRDSPPDTYVSACGFYWTEGNRGLGWAIDAVPAFKAGSGLGIPSPPAIRRSDGFIGVPDIRDAERLQGFRANWTLPAEGRGRSGRIRWRLVGNAVSVPVAQWIGERLRSEFGEIRGHVHPLSRDSSWPQAAFYDGKRRSAVDVTTWPVQRRSVGLEGFLRYPLKPLSPRATRGFTDRLLMSSLRYPAWFREELEQHWQAVAV